MFFDTTAMSPPPHEASDLEKYLKESTESQQNQSSSHDTGFGSDAATSADGGPAGSTANGDSGNGAVLNRASSIYSFSRNSFSNQLSQLTSVDFPPPGSLAESIEGHADALTAVNALSTAAGKIMKWVGKAGEVLTGLDADDDVEWAAAGGRQGLDDVDAAVSTFEGLVEMYVRMVDRVQLRGDIATVGTESLQNIIDEMEGILTRWTEVKSQLKGVKEQVELAMEWEELWATVLGDVGLEIDGLERLIFEMEENRHRTMVYDAENESGHKGLDINELENIVEDSPQDEHPRMGSLSTATSTLVKPQSPSPQSRSNNDDSMLLGLVARMQPLRASLDFLPMRLSLFQSRAASIFPTACEDLADRRDRLEKGYKKIELDAEALRRELSEDKWIIVFRNAGRQAQKMCDSVERSIVKLQEALDSPANGPTIPSTSTLTPKIENFEAKKVHYMPAIDRVLGIMQKGISDRLTVNGEIIRLHAELDERSHAIQGKTKGMEFLLTQLNTIRSQQEQQHHNLHQQTPFRDSVSSFQSMDSIARPRTGTPDSSPASSVIMTSSSSTHTPYHATSKYGNSRDASSNSTGTTTPRRISVKPLSNSSTSKRQSGIPRATGLLSPTSTSSFASSVSNFSRFIPSPASSPSLSQHNTGRRASSRSITPVPPVPPLPQKPRWNSSSNTNDLIVGHHYASTSPSPAYRRDMSRNRSASRNSSSSRLPRSLASEASGRRTPSVPTRGPMVNRNSASSPSPSTSSSPAVRPSHSRLGHHQPHRLGLSTFPPSPACGTPFDTSSIPESPTGSSILQPLPYPKRRDHHVQPASSSLSTSIHSSTKPSFSLAAKRPTTATGNHHYYGARPSTSMEHHESRRQSVLSPPRVKSGRQSSMGFPSRTDERPPWR